MKPGHRQEGRQQGLTSCFTLSLPGDQRTLTPDFSAREDGTSAAAAETYPPGKPRSPSKRICICGGDNGLGLVHTLSRHLSPVNGLTSMTYLMGNLLKRRAALGA